MTHGFPRPGGKRSRAALAWLVASLCLAAATRPVAAQPTAPPAALRPPAPNRPGLDRPIAAEKLVIAHYMTGMIPTPGGETRWIDPALYDPRGPTAAIGGLYQTVPVPSLLYPKLPPMKQAALLEMRTAKALGVDGFDFYYPFGPDEAFLDQYDRYVLAFFDAAKENGLDFKLTLCISPFGRPDLDVAQKAELLGKHLRGLMQRTDHSKNWLRTPDGRYLIYTWLADALVSTELGGKHWEIRDRPQLLGTVAAALDRAAEVAGVDAAFLYHLDQPGQPRLVEAALDYFPAVYGWVAVGDDLATWRKVAARCHERGRTYVQEVHPDYYTGKVFPRGGEDLIFDTSRILALGIGGIERHAQVLGLTQTFRDKLQMAIDLDSPLINLTTWNDYPEGHHLAPEINHNFGFALLLKDYLRRWRGDVSPPAQDAVIAFFKKYPAAAEPAPFDIAVREKKAVGPPDADDGIEVVTLLRAPGVLRVGDNPPRDVPAGLAVCRFPMTPGPVHAVVSRDGGGTVAELTTPEWITLAPYRTDRLTYSFSSAFDRLYGEVYGKDAPRHTSMEYAQDADGTPQWRRGVRTLVK